MTLWKSSIFAGLTALICLCSAQSFATELTSEKFEVTGNSGACFLGDPACDNGSQTNAAKGDAWDRAEKACKEVGHPHGAGHPNRVSNWTISRHYHHSPYCDDDCGGSYVRVSAFFECWEY